MGLGHAVLLSRDLVGDEPEGSEHLIGLVADEDGAGPCERADQVAGLEPGERAVGEQRREVGPERVEGVGGGEGGDGVAVSASASVAEP